MDKYLKEVDRFAYKKNKPFHAYTLEEKTFQTIKKKDIDKIVIDEQGGRTLEATVRKWEKYGFIQEGKRYLLIEKMKKVNKS